MTRMPPHDGLRRLGQFHHDGSEPLTEHVVPTEDVGPTDEPEERRAERQQHQRQRHRLRRFMDVVVGDRVMAVIVVTMAVFMFGRFAAVVSAEGHEEQTPRVERGAQRRDRAQEPCEATDSPVLPRLPKDLVLRNESRERGDARHR